MEWSTISGQHPSSGLSLNTVNLSSSISQPVSVFHAVQGSSSKLCPQKQVDWNKLFNGMAFSQFLNFPSLPFSQPTDAHVSCFRHSHIRPGGCSITWDSKCQIYWQPGLGSGNWVNADVYLAQMALTWPNYAVGAGAWTSTNACESHQMSAEMAAALKPVLLQGKFFFKKLPETSTRLRLYAPCAKRYEFIVGVCRVWSTT